MRIVHDVLKDLLNSQFTANGCNYAKDNGYLKFLPNLPNDCKIYLQMETQDIEKWNKEIAQFMGELVRKDGLIALKSSETITGHCITKAKYNYSFDWIMPVAEKIGRLSNWNFSLDISQSKQTVAVIFDNDYKFTASGSRFESSAYVTAEAIFYVVVMFLNKTKNYAEPHVQP